MYEFIRINVCKLFFTIYFMFVFNFYYYILKIDYWLSKIRNSTNTVVQEDNEKNILIKLAAKTGTPRSGIFGRY